MKQLIEKEFRLALHPTNIIFLALSLMLIIPNYPYYVTFFYTSLGIFFVCLSGRENNDIFYSALLPVKKRDIVKARIVFSVLLELMQIVIAIPFAILRSSFDMPGNQAGMDANISLFGISLIIIGAFNYIFFTKYYSSPESVGKVFAAASTVEFILIFCAEICCHTVPFFKNILDTPDPDNLLPKLLVLTAGLIIFAVLTLLAYKKSASAFEKLDL